MITPTAFSSLLITDVQLQADYSRTNCQWLASAGNCNYDTRYTQAGDLSLSAHYTGTPKDNAHISKSSTLKNWGGHTKFS